MFGRRRHPFVLLYHPRRPYIISTVWIVLLCLLVCSFKTKFCFFSVLASSQTHHTSTAPGADDDTVLSESINCDDSDDVISCLLDEFIRDGNVNNRNGGGAKGKLKEQRDDSTRTSRLDHHHHQKKKKSNNKERDFVTTTPRGGGEGHDGREHSFAKEREYLQQHAASRHHHHHHHHHTTSSSNIVDVVGGAGGESHPLPPPPIISRPVIATVPNYGKVEGRREGGTDIWRGIPYASPPVGSLRFAPPEPPQPWSPARLDGSKFGPDCWQLVDPLSNPTADTSYMSEDCLYLNVFTPAGHAARSKQGIVFSGTRLLPVMLWLHGGAFQQGGSARAEYDGRRLAERDVVVVTINYRLGALGFLVSSQDGLYGNFGLMDQRAAIEWVHDNIKAFGGDPDNVTLFGESAGAVMIGLHLMMDGAGTLFHRAIMQSNPLGYTFRSVVIADFIGGALKLAVDCKDLACLRAERVEEIMRAQSTLMGVPRSVGDFFTWGPILTKEVRVKLSLSRSGRFLSRSDDHRLPRLETDRSNGYVSEWRMGGDEVTSDTARWSAVNVSQPLKGLDKIPDDIPIIIGSNRHEGEMFVHSAFPAPMPKAVYWLFVGALFRDSGSMVLKHYRGMVEEVEREAEELARKQIEEEEAKHYYLENRKHLDDENKQFLEKNTLQKDKINNDGSDGLQALVNTWSTGGYQNPQHYELHRKNGTDVKQIDTSPANSAMKYLGTKLWGNETAAKFSREERASRKAREKKERQAARRKAKAMKEAARVVVDYRPVMSRIIDDYLFRCPTWHYAHLLSEGRERRGKSENNVFVYRFGQPTHIPGYRECWGKSCHTSELPYVFQAMDVIRSNYSTLGPIAQHEAPAAPEYPYTELMNAYHRAFESTSQHEETERNMVSIENERGAGKKNGGVGSNGRNHTHTKAFQAVLKHFFDDYFEEDADFELASDMADRWTAFAREGNPNYDGSKAEWMPWRYRPVGDDDGEDLDTDEGGDLYDLDDNPWLWEGEYDYFSDSDDDHSFVDTDEMYASRSQGQSARDNFYRRRALDALGMEVIDEDVFRTELRRVRHRDGPDDSYPSFLAGRRLFKNRRNGNVEEKIAPRMAKRAAQAAILMAQEMGAMGVGLAGESWDWIDDFFPELLELSWPPEGRLIERDCTCDMWDKIRYRY